MRAARTLALLVLATSSASCAATTYDTSITTQTLAPTTTVLPTGSAAELLPQLVTEAAGLSALIVAEGDKFAVVERMEALWGAVRNEVTNGDRETAIQIEAEIAKDRAAAKLNRPAGADKVYRSITDLVQGYLSSP